MHISFTELEFSLSHDKRVLVAHGTLDDHGLTGGLVRITGDVKVTLGAQEVFARVSESWADIIDPKHLSNWPSEFCDPKSIVGWPADMIGGSLPTHTIVLRKTTITHASKIWSLQESEKTEEEK